MAHRLALDLTQERACLFALSEDGWSCVGEAVLAGEDLHQRLSRLLARGIDVAGSDTPELLVSLPSDQMTYASLPAPSEGADRYEALSAEMTRLYPYLGDTPFLDWRPQGPWYQVAATPHAVLQEATCFLTACGIAPSTFTARPALAQFAGQPELRQSGNGGDGTWPDLPAPTDAVPAAAPSPSLRPYEDPAALRFAAAQERAHAAARTHPDNLTPLEDAPPQGSVLEKRASFRLPPLKLGRKAIGLGAMTALLAAALGIIALWPGLLTMGAHTTPADYEITEAGPRTHQPAILPPLVQPDLIAAPDSADEAEADMAELEDLEDLPPPIAPPEGDDSSVFYSAPPHLAQGAAAATLDDLLQPAIDPSFRTDALALPEMAEWQGALPPDAPRPPGPAAQVFVVDDRGLVTPSPDGTQTPDGLVVFAGAPPRVVPPRPEPDLDAVTLTVLRRADLPESDPLHRLQPRSRPDGLNERFERANLGGKTAAELSLFRPKQRPASQQQIVAASTVAGPALLNAPRPKQRSAQAAQRFASAQAARKADPVHTADTHVPRVASPANVARDATASADIDLSEVNLLGTFGSRGKPRALVRLPTGRVVNVSVGDRMDGGRVSEITQGRLSYVKSGRNISLVMPRG